MSLEDVAAAYVDDPDALTRAVAFTVDDGYRDFSTTGAPIFQEFNCPVTVFLPTAFVDGATWMWWDRISYAFEESPMRSVELRFAGSTVRFAWRGRQDVWVSAKRLVEAAKALPHEDRDLVIAELFERLRVVEPSTVPDRYAAMSWATVRDLERDGIRFGPHTATHPLLARLDAHRARWEMTHSWERLQKELRQPVPIFCYPNGRPEDVLIRDREVAEQIGMAAAVSTVPGHVVPGEGALRFFLPRLPLPITRWELRMYVEGVERAKARVRALASSILPLRLGA